MGGGVYMNVSVARSATTAVGAAGDSADQSATYTDFKADMQTDSKWGEESGPTAFMSSYKKELDLARQQLMSVKGGIAKFVVTMNTVIADLHDNDDAAASKLNAARTHSKISGDDLPVGVQVRNASDGWPSGH